ncbi:hypothetical protein AGMMS49975_01130 [Clostridia bacterium]|nr:hypothetical protein AGMMS49975_01130 [Clostridia bacterium]
MSEDSLKEEIDVTVEEEDDDSDLDLNEYESAALESLEDDYDYDEEIVELSLWQWIASFFIRFWHFITGYREQVNLEVISKFKIILDEMDKKAAGYDDAAESSVLCEEALKIARQRLLLAGKISSLDEKIAEVKCFENLSDLDTEKLQNMLQSYLSLSRERSALLYQVTEFDASLVKMTRLEEDANNYVDDITNAEEHYRMLKRDLGYLEGEKAELEYEKEYLERGQKFIQKFSVFMVSIFAAATIVLAFLFVFRDFPILFPMAIMVILLMVILFVLYLFRRRLVYELKLNLKKQKRAVALLNRKNAVYAYYINYLNHEYKKYKVKNSQMLRRNIKDYEAYKYLTKRLDNIRNIMSQTEEQIEKFLRTKKINHLSTSVEHFAQSINVVDKQQYHKDLMKERRIMEKTLTDLDNRHEEIWDLLIEMNQSDISDGKFVDRIISAYLEEVERIFFVTSTAEEKGDTK